MDSRWRVVYSDGSSLAEADAAGLKSIEWGRVTELHLESAAAQSVFDIHQPPAGHYLALRARSWVAVNIATDAVVDHVRGFLLCTFDDGVTVDPDQVDTYEAALKVAVYWLPDGSVHTCPYFRCALVADYARGLLPELPPECGPVVGHR